MNIIKVIVVLLCVQGGLRAASTAALNIENLRGVPHIKLQTEDIVNLLGGSTVVRKGIVWSLFGTSFVGGVGHISYANEISDSKELDFDWLFYVKECDGKHVLILHKMFNTYMGDERLLISTPVTDDIADNPWVRATTVCEEDSAEGFANIKQLFKPFMRKE